MSKNNGTAEWELNGSEGVLVLVCPECDRENRYPFRDLAPGLMVKCECGGGEFLFSGDDLSALQAWLDRPDAMDFFDVTFQVTDE